MIVLTFDIEEFDVPKEKGIEISQESSVQISRIGTAKILDILRKNNVKATLFCTSNFATEAKDIIELAIKDGHEIASHGCDHWQPKADDPKTSKEILTDLFGIPVRGYRQPRMFDVDNKLLEECGYKYNASINPCFIPGKYAHMDVSRTPFMQGEVLQIPTSVTPYTRIPMFWLALHTYPLPVYEKFADSILKHDGYFTTYFHPWEFVDHPTNIQKAMLPIVNHNNGSDMCNRLKHLINHFKEQGEEFTTMSQFMISYN